MRTYDVERDRYVGNPTCSQYDRLQRQHEAAMGALRDIQTMVAAVASAVRCCREALNENEHSDDGR